MALDISVTLWIVNNNKKARTLNERKLRDRRGTVLFVDLRRWNTNTDKGYVIFDDTQVEAVKKIYNGWQTGKGYKDVPELCRAVGIEEIRRQNYSLAPSKYVEFVDHDLEIDYESEMGRIQGEIREVLRAEKGAQKMLEKAFKGIGYDVGGGGK